MATTPVQFKAPSGLTLTLKLFPHGSDTIANGASGDSATEKTNALGLYSADVTQALTGLHDVLIVDGSGNVIALFTCKLFDNTTIVRCTDEVITLTHMPVRAAKNVAFQILIFMRTTSDNVSPKTGLAPVVQVFGDGGSFSTASASPATEIGNGFYKITLTAAEMNFDNVGFKATATGALQESGAIYPQAN